MGFSLIQPHQEDLARLNQAPPAESEGALRHMLDRLRSDPDPASVVEDVARLIMQCRYVLNRHKAERGFFALVRDAFVSFLEKASTLRAAGNMDGALRIYETLFTLKIDGIDIHQALAEIYLTQGRLDDALFHARYLLCYCARNEISKELVAQVHAARGEPLECSRYRSLGVAPQESFPFSWDVNAPKSRFFPALRNPEIPSTWAFGDSHSDVFLYSAAHGLSTRRNLSVAVAPGATAAGLGSEMFKPSMQDLIEYYLPRVQSDDDIIFAVGANDAYYAAVADGVSMSLARAVLKKTLRIHRRFLEQVFKGRERNLVILGVLPPVVESTNVNVWGMGPFAVSLSERHELVCFYNDGLKEMTDALGVRFINLMDHLIEGGDGEPRVKRRFVIHDLDDHLNHIELATLWIDHLTL